MKSFSEIGIAHDNHLCALSLVCFVKSYLKFISGELTNIAIPILVKHGESLFQFLRAQALLFCHHHNKFIEVNLPIP